MSEIHDYPVRVSWSGGRAGSGTVQSFDGSIEAELAVPTEFQGRGGAANPEQLLTCAIASCYAITFGIIAENRKLPVESVEVDAVGHVDASSHLPKYTSVDLHPKIRVNSPTDDQRRVILEMAEKADAYCIVTNTLRDKVAIRVEPTIVEA